MVMGQRSPREVVLDRSTTERAPAPALDPQQRAVVEHRDGHLLVLAGPGTGKTTTLAELIVARIGPSAGPERIDAGQVLALTFGRRAARELADRISRRLGGGAVPVVSTFHSFAYGVLRQYADPSAFLSPPRLLTAAEQDARLRELLAFSVAEGRLAWPAALAGAVGTRGIAEQVRALLARARGQGLDGRDLARFGRRDGVPVWSAIGGFFKEYLDTLGFEGALDYAELINNVVALASKEKEGRALRETYRLIVVDEYQDTDPAQVRLLAELARGGAQIVAVGDPDQAIYGFRGSDLRGILRFPEQFRDPASGEPARVEVLRTTRRFPQPIAEAAQRVLGPLPPGLPAEVVRLHRSPVAADGPAVVEARTYPRASAQATGIAETLLRAHAGFDGRAPVPWSEMAVLVRNPAVHAPPIARALRASGIPVALAADELALADEPGVQTLLSIVALAADPGSVPEDTGRMLLSGPVGRMDPVAIRALARAALDEHRLLQDAAVGRFVSSGDVESDLAFDTDTNRGSDSVAVSDVASDSAAAEPAVASDSDPISEPTVAFDPDPDPAASQSRAAEPAMPAASRAETGVDLRAVQGASRPSADALLTAAVASAVAPSGALGGARADDGLTRVAAAVAAARSAISSGALVSEVLWAAWSATDWPDRLRERALRGGYSATSANRDLDGLVALFDLANRLPAQRAGLVGVLGFLTEVRQLRIPQEPGASPEAERDQVRLLSAHRAKGLEWEVVVVAAVQEGEWPDVRLRSDLLHVDELDRTGRQAARTYRDLLAEERRLMYVACTRARSMLVATAVEEPVDGAAQPSRFLAELGVPVVAQPGRSTSPVSGPALVTALRAAAVAPRRVLADGSPDPDVERLRAAAIRRLAALARRSRGAGLGGPLAAADPARWWGVRAATPAFAAPVPEPTIRLSPSAVEALRTCPLRWFLERKVGAGTPAGTAAVIGVVVHAVAEALATGDAAEDFDSIDALIDRIWSGMPFAARYQSAHERARVEEMVVALVEWQRSAGRQQVAAEAPFEFTLPTPSGTVTLAGTIDRVDRDSEGRLHLVDYKTGKSAASVAATAEHAQLGVYQLAVRDGALGIAGAEGSSTAAAGPAAATAVGGAELVHLADRFTSGMPKVRLQAPLPEGRTWVHEVVVDAARLAIGPDFPARRNGRCSSCAFQEMCPAHAVGASAAAQSTAGFAAGQPAPAASQPAATQPAASQPAAGRLAAAVPAAAVPPTEAAAT